MLAHVLEACAPREHADELARNVAAVVVMLAVTNDSMPLDAIVRTMLVGRRERFPSSPWGLLLDAEIDRIAADSARAWARVAFDPSAPPMPSYRPVRPRMQA